MTKNYKSNLDQNIIYPNKNWGDNLFWLLLLPNGRINRQKYYLGLLLIIVFLSLVMSVFVGPLYHYLSSSIKLSFFAISFLLLLYSRIMLDIKRLHDLGDSGWWVIMSVVPVIGVVFAFYRFFVKGSEGKNCFGEDVIEKRIFLNEEFRVLFE